VNAYVGRLAGAILLQHSEQMFLIGNTKQPCDWTASGVAQPAEIDALKRPFLALAPLRSTEVPKPRLSIAVGEGQVPEALAQSLADRLLIARNGSVSDRLWRLLLQEGDDPESLAEEVDATWLVEMPAHIWNMVRETVLRCV
jgi:hypothetical protein